MRLSMDEGDPGYSPLARGVRVFLDGIERTMVVTADEEKRALVRYVTNDKGRLRVNATGDDIERETLHGDVRIEVPAGHPSEHVGWLRNGEASERFARGGPIAAGQTYRV
jgi:hypothetical protein